MTPYDYGQAITLVPEEVVDCDLAKGMSNIEVVVPYLPNDIKNTPPLPLTKRDRVTVYVSGASDKCKWLYPLFSSMVEHNFYIYIPIGEPPCEIGNCAHINFIPVNRDSFIKSIQRSYVVVTNSGMQLAAELRYLHVRNFAFPTQNHHAQCAVAESIERNHLGVACLLEIANKSKRSCSLVGKLHNYLNESKSFSSTNHAGYMQYNTDLLISEKNKQEEHLLNVFNIASKLKKNSRWGQYHTRVFLTLLPFLCVFILLFLIVFVIIRKRKQKNKPV